MKKIVLMAVFAASGLVFVSCDSGEIESATRQSKGASLQKEMNYNKITVKIEDTIPTPIPVTNLTDGPGDDVIIITPPPPRK
jgi:hypothetical protein